MVELMRERRLNKNQVARGVGVHPSQVNYWYTGRYAPSADSLVRLCRLLGVPPSELLNLEEALAHEDLIAFIKRALGIEEGVVLEAMSEISYEDRREFAGRALGWIEGYKIGKR